MEYFWKQQDDIPYGTGYPLFGKEHLTSTLLTLSAVCLFILLFTRLDRRKRKQMLRAIPFIMIFLEIFKDLFLVTIHRFSVWYLPLHVCSIGIFVFLLRELIPNEKTKMILGEITVILIMPGSLAALIFPDWTVYYPVLNFINLHSYLWHGLLVLYPLLLLIDGEAKPTVKHIHYPILFLCLVVPGIYAFDKHFGTNYFFVNYPEKGTPLEWLAGFMGNPGYLAGYAILAIAVMLAVYLVIYTIEKIISTRKMP
ncbi:MAG: YwaF family protein [Lachnospiraceae bacterium]|nr:YwaF family protein [Lachnospiraceae bacterium]